MSGWVKVHRKIIDWEWFKDDKAFKVFMYLIMMATHKTTKFRGIELKAGDLVTGRKKIAADCGITEQSVRTALEHLKSTKDITIETTNRFSIISVCNYETYQIKETDNNQHSNQPATNQQPTNNHIQEGKEVKEVKKDQEPIGDESPGEIKKAEKLKKDRAKLKELLTHEYFNNPKFCEFWDDWKNHKGKGYSVNAQKLQLRQLLRFNVDVCIASMEKSLSACWKGIVINESYQPANNPKISYDEKKEQGLEDFIKEAENQENSENYRAVQLNNNSLEG